MPEREILKPAGWPRPKGYSNGVVASGRFVFIAGQIGWNEEEQITSDDIVDQIRQALQNTLAVMKAGGVLRENVVRMTWYITDKAGYLSRQEQIGEAYREIMGPSYPAMSLVIVSALLHDRAKVEIETTAVLPQ